MDTRLLALTRSVKRLEAKLQGLETNVDNNVRSDLLKLVVFEQGKLNTLEDDMTKELMAHRKIINRENVNTYLSVTDYTRWTKKLGDRLAADWSSIDLRLRKLEGAAVTVTTAINYADVTVFPAIRWERRPINAHAKLEAHLHGKIMSPVMASRHANGVLLTLGDIVEIDVLSPSDVYYVGGVNPVVDYVGGVRTWTTGHRVISQRPHGDTFVISFLVATGIHAPFVGEVDTSSLILRFVGEQSAAAGMTFTNPTEITIAPTSVEYVTAVQMEDTVNGIGVISTALLFTATFNPISTPSYTFDGVTYSDGLFDRYAWVRDWNLTLIGAVSFTHLTSFAGLRAPDRIMIHELATLEQKVAQNRSDIAALKVALASRPSNGWQEIFSRAAGIFSTVGMVFGGIGPQLFALSGTLSLIVKVSEMSHSEHLSVLSVILDSGDSLAMIVGGLSRRSNSAAVTDISGDNVSAAVRHATHVNNMDRVNENMALVKKYPEAMQSHHVWGGDTFLHYENIKAENTGVGGEHLNIAGDIAQYVQTDEQILNRRIQPLHGTVERRIYHEGNDGDGIKLQRQVTIRGWGEGKNNPRTVYKPVTGIGSVILPRAPFGERVFIEKWNGAEWEHSRNLTAGLLDISPAEADALYVTNKAKWSQLNVNPSGRTWRLDPLSMKFPPHIGDLFYEHYKALIPNYSLEDSNCNGAVIEYREFMMDGTWPSWMGPDARNTVSRSIYEAQMAYAGVTSPPELEY
jgi:hypothetical protein